MTRKKRARTREFGAPSDADDMDQAAQNSAPSSSSSSTRTLPTLHVPSLSNLCARVFAANFIKLHNKQHTWKKTSAYLELVPDSLILKLFSMLCVTCPTFISHEIITTYFMRNNVLTLSHELPGVRKHTLQAIPRVNNSLQELRITGFGKFGDDVFASVVSQLPELRILVLAECRAVSSKTVEAATATCPQLRVVNLNYTAASPASVATLLVSCPQLEVLKVAKISSWTDATFSKFLSSVDPGFRHVGIRTLKVRQTSLSDASMAALCEMCPNIQRLDVSFTAVRRPSPWLTSGIGPQITKLLLTSTAISGPALLDVLAALTNLTKLSLGALGLGTSPNTSVSNTSAMTLTDNDLYSLTDILASHGRLESLSLVNNAKLGFNNKGKGSLQHLIKLVGRNCKYLNLSSINYLCSSDLIGLIPDPENANQAPSLQTLLLNNTGVDDDAAPFLSCCPDLETLELAGTKVTEEGLLPIVDACHRLKNLDLTSCRGVSVADRRRFFTVWAEARK